MTLFLIFLSMQPQKLYDVFPHIMYKNFTSVYFTIYKQISRHINLFVGFICYVMQLQKFCVPKMYSNILHICCVYGSKFSGDREKHLWYSCNWVIWYCLCHPSPTYLCMQLGTWQLIMVRLCVGRFFLQETVINIFTSSKSTNSQHLSCSLLFSHVSFCSVLASLIGISVDPWNV